MALPTSRKPVKRKLVERIAFAVLFTLACFWIFAVFALTLHSFHRTIRGTTPQRAIPPPVQPHELVKKSVAHVPQLSPVDLPKFMSPLIIFTCKRDNYLNQTMKEVLDYLPQTCEIGCPIIISQDGNDENVAKVVKMYQDRYQDVIPIFHLQHEQQQAQPISTGQLKGRLPPGFAYKALALHYGWGLQHAFDGMKGYPKPDRLIVLEEDLHISPDFFDYFAHMAPILDQDDTLLAVSAFNDNGKVGKVKDETRVLRSDFFPGLGWILTRKLWDTELSSKWPGGYWDDWLREPAQRQGRHILRPEISRTFHFGVKGGASNNQFGDKLGEIHLNQKKVDWSTVDLSYLKPNTYDRAYFSLISMAQHVDDWKSALEISKTRDVRLEYKSFPEFQRIAAKFNIMSDEKAGIPRTAYRGVIELRPHGDFLLFITPPMDETLKASFHLA